MDAVRSGTSWTARSCVAKTVGVVLLRRAAIILVLRYGRKESAAPRVAGSAEVAESSGREHSARAEPRRRHCRPDPPCAGEHRAMSTCSHVSLTHGVHARTSRRNASVQLGEQASTDVTPDSSSEAPTCHCSRAQGNVFIHIDPMLMLGVYDARERRTVPDDGDSDNRATTAGRKRATMVVVCAVQDVMRVRSVRTRERRGRVMTMLQSSTLR